MGRSNWHLPGKRVGHDAFERVINVNLLGSWHTVRAALPHVIASQGYILFISSIAGTTQGPLNAAYNASKAGLQAFANSLRLEVQGLGVDVGVAHILYIATETGRGAVEHPLIRGLAGLQKMKPEPVEKTAAMLVRGIERRSRTVCKPVARLAFLAPAVSQLVVEHLARRHGWAAIIRAQEQADGEETPDRATEAELLEKDFGTLARERRRERSSPVSVRERMLPFPALCEQEEHAHDVS